MQTFIFKIKRHQTVDKRKYFTPVYCNITRSCVDRPLDINEHGTWFCSKKKPLFTTSIHLVLSYEDLFKPHSWNRPPFPKPGLINCFENTERIQLANDRLTHHQSTVHVMCMVQEKIAILINRNAERVIIFENQKRPVSARRHQTTRPNVWMRGTIEADKLLCGKHYGQVLNLKITRVHQLKILNDMFVASA